MFLRKNQKRSLDVDAVLKQARDEDSLELEKGDMKAMILAAFAVFMPFALLFVGGLALVVFLILGIAS